MYTNRARKLLSRIKDIESNIQSASHFTEIEKEIKSIEDEYSRAKEEFTGAYKISPNNVPVMMNWNNIKRSHNIAEAKHQVNIAVDETRKTQINKNKAIDNWTVALKSATDAEKNKNVNNALKKSLKSLEISKEVEKIARKHINSLKRLANARNNYAKLANTNNARKTATITRDFILRANQELLKLKQGIENSHKKLSEHTKLATYERSQKLLHSKLEAKRKAKEEEERLKAKANEEKRLKAEAEDNARRLLQNRLEAKRKAKENEAIVSKIVENAIKRAKYSAVARNAATKVKNKQERIKAYENKKKQQGIRELIQQGVNKFDPVKMNMDNYLRGLERNYKEQKKYEQLPVLRNIKSEQVYNGVVAGIQQKNLNYKIHKKAAESIIQKLQVLPDGTYIDPHLEELPEAQQKIVKNFISTNVEKIYNLITTRSGSIIRFQPQKVNGWTQKQKDGITQVKANINTELGKRQRKPTNIQRKRIYAIRFAQYLRNPSDQIIQSRRPQTPEYVRNLPEELYNDDNPIV